LSPPPLSQRAPCSLPSIVAKTWGWPSHTDGSTWLSSPPASLVSVGENENVAATWPLRSRDRAGPVLLGIVQAAGTV
jgi:hypothetical protein